MSLIQSIAQKRRFEKQSAWNKGIPNTWYNGEGLKLGRGWNKGKPNTWNNGEKSNFWKGGISKITRTERRNAMQTLEYKLWREAVFTRDNYTCQICGQYSGYLQADHIKPWVTHSELRYAIDNGITLCLNCHKLKTSMDWKNYNFRAVKEVS